MSATISNDALWAEALNALPTITKKVEPVTEGASCPEDNFFHVNNFFSSAYHCLSYMDYRSWLQDCHDEDCVDWENDRNEDVTDVLENLNSNKDTDAGLRIVNTPVGDICLVGKTYRQVLDILHKRFTPALDTYEKIEIYNGKLFHYKLWQFRGFNSQGVAQWEHGDTLISYPGDDSDSE